MTIRWWVGVATAAIVLIVAAALHPSAASQDIQRTANVQEAQDVVALSAGRETFVQFCAPCHGRDAKGGGPVASLLLTRPSDLTQISRRNDGAFPLAALEGELLETRLPTSAHGSVQMPIWGRTFLAIDASATLVRARVANLLAYLESMQQ